MTMLMRSEIGDRRRVLLLVVVLAGVSACASPRSHTPEPYASDPVAAQALTERAHEFCAASGRNSGVSPIRDFVTDGCSRFPDFEWNVECCVEHDIAYWCGGTAEERLEADRVFGQCVSTNTNGFVGGLMRSGVRLGGHPFFPSSYRWGYGHAYRPGYPSAIQEP